MASPDSPLHRLQATHDFGGKAVQAWVYANLPLDASILDVGAGWGKYRNLLPDYEKVDACEVWKPYIEQERLRERYRYVWQCNVTEVGCLNLQDYDAVIFGDVLEHLSVEDATEVLSHCKRALVVVPFLFEQGPEDDNPFEEHLQADLTEDVMRDRYPDLVLHSLEYTSREAGHWDEYQIEQGVAHWYRAGRDVGPPRQFKGFYVKAPRE